MQPDPSQPEVQQVPASGPQGGDLDKAVPRKFNWKIPILVILILAVAGLGYWTWQLSTNLKAAQQSLSALQGKYDDLTAENSRLTTELGQTSSELEQTSTELAGTNDTLKTTRSDTSKLKQEASNLQSKKDKSFKYVDVMRGIFEDNDTFFETMLKVIITGDAKLLELYNTYTKSRSTTDLGNWTEHLLTKAVELLK